MQATLPRSLTLKGEEKKKWQVEKAVRILGRLLRVEYAQEHKMEKA